jgi:hypothetical protein
MILLILIQSALIVILAEGFCCTLASFVQPDLF